MNAERWLKSFDRVYGKPWPLAGTRLGEVVRRVPVSGGGPERKAQALDVLNAAIDHMWEFRDAVDLGWLFKEAKMPQCPTAAAVDRRALALARYEMSVLMRGEG